MKKKQKGLVWSKCYTVTSLWESLKQDAKWFGIAATILLPGLLLINFVPTEVTIIIWFLTAVAEIMFVIMPTSGEPYPYQFHGYPKGEMLEEARLKADQIARWKARHERRHGTKPPKS